LNFYKQDEVMDRQMKCTLSWPPVLDHQRIGDGEYAEQLKHRTIKKKTPMHDIAGPAWALTIARKAPMLHQHHLNIATRN
jgi:hypothetical protein